jgi:ribosomal protein S12 methylthiotransferase accessory factor
VIDLGSTVREVEVGRTLAKAREVLDRIGISRVGNVTGLDHVGVPTWIAVRPLARSLTVSQGQGLTHELAAASAVMESIELHHAEHFVPTGHSATIVAAAADDRYVDCSLLPIAADVALDRTTATRWVEGRELRSNRRRWVPRDCIDLDSVTTADAARLFVSSSNGLASGNSREEAVLHALCELIERDQTSFWLAHRSFERGSGGPRLRLDDIADPACRWLLDRCAAAGVAVRAWATHSTIAVPGFLCTVFDATGRTHFAQSTSGFGCHPLRRIALARAITEALQSRLTCIAGGRDDFGWDTYAGALRTDTAAFARWLARVDAEPAVDGWGGAPEAPASATMGDLVDWVLDALAAAQLPEAIVVDLTQDDIDIPVVHATVPGLEAMFGEPHYTPGPRMQRLLAPRLAAEGAGR